MFALDFFKQMFQGTPQHLDSWHCPWSDFPDHSGSCLFSHQLLLLLMLVIVSFWCLQPENCMQERSKKGSMALLGHAGFCKQLGSQSVEQRRLQDVKAGLGSVERWGKEEKKWQASALRACKTERWLASSQKCTGCIKLPRLDIGPLTSCMTLNRYLMSLNQFLPLDLEYINTCSLELVKGQKI